MLTHEEIEAKKQLFGIKVILIIDNILFSILFIGGVFTSFDEAYYYGAGSGFGLFLSNLIVFGGLIYMTSMGLVGLNNRKKYSIPICRTALILTGLVPILLFWSRLNNPLVKRYLNYGFEAIKEELTNNSTGKTETQLKIESVKVDKKYCTYCGEELPMNASFCKRCGKSVEIIKVKNINNTRKCPYCFREVASDAKKCKYCGGVDLEGWI